MPKPMVIYHSKCADGFASAWCFWRKFKDNMDYYPGIYNKSPPDVTDRDVFLVDFSYKHDVIKDMAETAKSITILDHHQSSLEDLWDIAGREVDMQFCTIEKSGAMIAWDYLQSKTSKREKIPKILKHIQDRDLWKFELYGSKEISMYLFSFPYDFKIWDSLINSSPSKIKEMIRIGGVLQMKHMKDIEELLSQCTRQLDICGWPVPVANLPYTMASDAGMLMSKNAPFAATYYDTENSRVFSLRSNPEFEHFEDVAKIAEQFNGGGHKHASGFKVNREHPLARC